MPPKPIQEQFGQAIIDAVNSFAAQDLQSVDAIESVHFTHIGDATLKRRLAETFYGARWIYKLGLALLVRNVEQIAHVRAQLIDYAAVCEGLLSSMIDHGLAANHLTGQKYKFRDPDQQQKPLNWNIGHRLTKLNKQSLYWLITVAAEEGIVSQQLATRLQWLREERNRVHVRARSHQSFLDRSKEAFDVVIGVIAQTKVWKSNHP